MNAVGIVSVYVLHGCKGVLGNNNMGCWGIGITRIELDIMVKTSLNVANIQVGFKNKFNENNVFLKAMHYFITKK